jgi:CxxC motif-containing protein (DUF1111 family)
MGANSIASVYIKVICWDVGWIEEECGSADCQACHVRRAISPDRPKSPLSSHNIIYPFAFFILGSPDTNLVT